MRDADGYKWLRGILRAEMARQSITYGELAARLQTLGVQETDANLRNKIGRGKFSALFFVQCLEVLGVEELKVSMIADIGFPFSKPSRRIQASKSLRATSDVFADMLADDLKEHPIYRDDEE